MGQLLLRQKNKGLFQALLMWALLIITNNMLMHMKFLVLIEKMN